MKKLYTLAIAMLSFAAASAQTITLYHNGSAVNDGETITVTTAEISTKPSTGKNIYSLDAGISLLGSADGTIAVTAKRNASEKTVSSTFKVCPELCYNIEDGDDNAKSMSFTFAYKTDSEAQNMRVDAETDFLDPETVVTIKEEYEMTFAYYGVDASKRTIKIVFDYSSASTAAVSDIATDSDNAAAEYFNLNGVSVNGDSLTPGLYIRRQGDKTTKVVVK
jgi:hypothetical protein